MILKIDPSIAAAEVPEIELQKKESPATPEASKNETSTIASAVGGSQKSSQKGVLKIALRKLLELCSRIPLLGRLARWLQEKFGLLPGKAAPQTTSGTTSTATTAETPTETQRTEEPVSDEPENHPPTPLFSEVYAKSLKRKLVQLLTSNSPESSAALENLMESFIQDRAAKDQLCELSAACAASVKTIQDKISSKISDGELLKLIHSKASGDQEIITVDAMRLVFDELLVLASFGRCRETAQPQNDFMEQILQLTRANKVEEVNAIALSLWNDMKRLAIIPNRSSSETDLCARVIAKYANLPCEESSWEKRGIETCRAILQGCATQQETEAALTLQRQSFTATTTLSEDVVNGAFAEAELEHLLAITLFDEWDGSFALKEIEQVARSHIKRAQVPGHDPDLITTKATVVANLLTTMICLQPVSALPELFAERTYTDEQWRNFAKQIANSGIDLYPGHTKDIVECALDQIDGSNGAKISEETAETLQGLLKAICDTCTQFSEESQNGSHQS